MMVQSNDENSKVMLETSVSKARLFNTDCAAPSSNAETQLRWFLLLLIIVQGLLLAWVY